MANPTSATPPARGGYRAVLAVGEFRAMFAAHVISALGDDVAIIALAVLVYERSRSPLLSALSFAIGFLPHALGGTLLLSVADRVPARMALVGCNLASAALAGLLAIPGMPVPVLLVLLVPLGAIAPVFKGAQAGSLPEVLGGLGPSGFVLGRSLLRMVNQATQVGGFAVGGALLVVVTPHTALLGNAASFLVSAALLRLGTRWRPARALGEPAGAGAARVRVARESLASLRFLLASPWLRALLLLRWLPPAFAVAPEALAVPYATELHAGPGAAGLLLAAAPVGALAGEALSGVLLDRALRDRLLVPLAVASFLPLLGFAARPGLLLAVALLLLAGVGSAYALGLDQRFFEATPKPLLGRAMSVASAGVMLSNGLGFAAAGAAAQALPPPAVVTAAGIMGLAVVLALARAAASPLWSRNGLPKTVT